MFAGGIMGRGKYVLYVKANWKYWDEHEIVLSAYGEKKLLIKEIEKVPNFISDVYIGRAKQNKEIQDYGGENRDIIKCKEILMEEGYEY